jgi:hypothetical protein
MIATILGSAPAPAVDMESLVSPGPLSAIHEREVHACSDCHTRFDRGAQNPLCVECHKDIAKDQAAGTGFHGRLEGGSETPCRSCHGEHRGADAEIVALVPESFDHERTDMPLRGAHAALACGACHESGRAYREAPMRCVDCHGENDPHGGRLGDDCASCHQPRAWSDTRFDHSKTRFPLEDAHARVECALCHPQERYKDTPRDCVGCHRIDDAHRGQLGTKCGKCHDSRSWKKSGFDHRRETGFALEGRHASAECRSCHVRPPSEQKLEKTCIACHRADDDHAGLLGTRCESCHDARAWASSRFDHARDAKWALHGAHQDLACSQCHLKKTSAKSAPTPSACVDCHRSVDVHVGSLGDRCERCHESSSWRTSVRFDHEFTHFPLLGLHRLATCEECHQSPRFVEASEECVACHAANDEHDRRLGTQCEDCHNPNAWDRWTFDHDTRTRFALRGGHQGLACIACHRKPVTGAIELTTRCSGCHLQDSPHADSFGRNCESCHVEESWKTIREGMRR